MIKKAKNIIGNNPLLTFLIIGVLLTEASLIFPQRIGNFQKVAGWPLTMHKVYYKVVGNFTTSGEIVHNIIKSDSEMFWNMAFLNILIWTLLLYSTWLVYEKRGKNKSNQANRFFLKLLKK